MNIKNRIKRIETAILAKWLEDETYPITLEQWRRYASGEDVLPEIPTARRKAFFEWQEKATSRRREAAETLAMFES